MKFEKLANRLDFDNDPSSLLFVEKDWRANKSFALVYGETSSFKFSWNSDIEPVIKNVSSEIYCVGVDQNFSIVNLQNGEVLLGLNLDCFFLDVEVLAELIIAIAEFEIIVIDRSSFKVVGTIELPDILKEIEIKDGRIRIACLNGEMIQTVLNRPKG